MVRTPDLPAHGASCYAIPTSEQDDLAMNLLISHILDRATPYNCVIKIHISLFIPMNRLHVSNRLTVHHQEALTAYAVCGMHVR